MARWRGLLLASGVWTGLLAPAAHAEEAADCGAVDGGALNVALGPAARAAERAVRLKAGDGLSVVVHAGTGSSASLALRGGDGPWQTLLEGRAGASAAFVAPVEGAFALRFAARGAKAVTFTVTCVPGEIADGAELRVGDPVAAAAAPKDALAENGASSKPAAGPAPAHAAGVALKLEKRDLDAAASGLDLGVSYKLWPAIMVGALAQFDQSTAALAGLPLSLSDRTWMAGPVTTVQVAPGMALDMRAAWGFAETGATDLDPKAASAERRLLSARLANTQAFGALRFTPSVTLNHLQETQHAAPLSPAEAAMAHAVNSGRVDFGPELAYRFDLAHAAFIEPKAAIGGFWGFDSLTKLAPGYAAHNDMRLKAEAGVTFGVTDGAKLQAGGGVEAGDGVAPDIWTGRLQLSIPLK
jgi:hypothetical protein